MKDQLEERLKALKAEFESGRKMLADLDARKARLQQSLLRISGAIQVLQEELNDDLSDNGQVVGETTPAAEHAAV